MRSSWVAQHRVRHWDVSNFDTAGMEKLVDDAGGTPCVTNQIPYSIAQGADRNSTCRRGSQRVGCR